MIDPALTSDDVRFVLTSLEFTRMKFEVYPYPTEELRRERLAELRQVVERMRDLRDTLKEWERIERRANRY